MKNQEYKCKVIINNKVNIAIIRGPSWTPKTSNSPWSSISIGGGRDAWCEKEFTVPTKGNGTPNEDELMVEAPNEKQHHQFSQSSNKATHINNQACHRDKSLVPCVLMSVI